MVDWREAGVRGGLGLGLTQAGPLLLDEVSISVIGEAQFLVRWGGGGG